MAQFEPKKLNIGEINDGKRFNNGDGVSAEAINAPIEAALHIENVVEEMQEAVNNLSKATVVTVNGEEKATWNADSKLDIEVPTNSGSYQTYVYTKHKNGETGTRTKLVHGNNEYPPSVAEFIRGVPQYNDNGNLCGNTPIEPYELARKDYVDSYQGLTKAEYRDGQYVNGFLAVSYDDTPKIVRKSAAGQPPRARSLVMFDDYARLHTDMPTYRGKNQNGVDDTGFTEHGDTLAVNLKYFNENKGVKVHYGNLGYYSSTELPLVGSRIIIIGTPPEYNEGDVLIDNTHGFVVLADPKLPPDVDPYYCMEGEVIGYLPRQQVTPTKLYKHKLTISGEVEGVVVDFSISFISRNAVAIIIKDGGGFGYEEDYPEMIGTLCAKYEAGAYSPFGIDGIYQYNTNQIEIYRQFTANGYIVNNPTFNDYVIEI